MEIKETLNKIIFSNRRRKISQLLISGALGATIGFFGFPFKIYTLGTVTCDSVGCGSGQPSQLFEANLAANIVIWYIVLGILYSAYKRWKNEV